METGNGNQRTKPIVTHGNNSTLSPAPSLSDRHSQVNMYYLFLLSLKSKLFLHLHAPSTPNLCLMVRTPNTTFRWI